MFWRFPMIRMVIALFLLSVCFLSPTMARKKDRNWQTGKLTGISQNVDRQWVVMGDLLPIVIPDQTVTTTYTIYANGFMYSGTAVKKRRKIYPFKVFQIVSFAVEKDHLYIIDNKNKERKLKLTR